MNFDFKTADATAIDRKGRALVGRPLDALSDRAELRRPSSASTKGVVGSVIERYFGIAQNSRPEADFVGAGIELKTVPILVTAIESRAKERISLGMIDWTALAGESWATAKARRKLEHLMLVFYGWEPYRPLGAFQVLAAGIWRPDAETSASLERDWRLIQALELSGRRSDVSESLTRLLGAATKGPGHGSTSRAWSLKQPFVSWIYRSMAGATPVPHRSADVDPERAFEEQVLARLAEIEGSALSHVAVRVGRPIGEAKSAGANLIRTFLGQPTRGRSGDFERFGVELKTVPTSPAGRPLEATSFPAFVHEELIFETWPESDLLGRLNRILFVPLVRSHGDDPRSAVVGRARFWSPTERELNGISVEWDDVRQLIEEGHASRLPPASATTYIHVRPKARDARDRDPAPGGGDVIRKAFWLNQAYVERILRERP